MEKITFKVSSGLGLATLGEAEQNQREKEISASLKESEFFKQFAKADTLSFDRYPASRLPLEDIKNLFEQITLKAESLLPKVREYLAAAEKKKLILRLDSIGESVAGLRKEILEYAKKQPDEPRTFWSMTAVFFADGFGLREVLMFEREMEQKHGWRIEYDIWASSEHESEQLATALLGIYNLLRLAISGANLPGGDLIMFSYPFKTDIFEICEFLREQTPPTSDSRKPWFNQGIEETLANLKKLDVNKSDLSRDHYHRTMIEIELERKEQMASLENLRIAFEGLIGEHFKGAKVWNAKKREYNWKSDMPKRGYETGHELQVVLKSGKEKILLVKNELSNKTDSLTIPWSIREGRKLAPVAKFLKLKKSIDIDSQLDACQGAIEACAALAPKSLD